MNPGSLCIYTPSQLLFPEAAAPPSPPSPPPPRPTVGGKTQRPAGTVSDDVTRR